MKSNIEQFLKNFLGETYEFLLPARKEVIEKGSITEERIVFIKKSIKTIITMKFTEEGFPCHMTWETEYIPSPNEEEYNRLEIELKEALEQEDYRRCAEIKKKQKKIVRLR